MFETILIIMIVLLATYVYVNEQAKKKGKMPFSNRLDSIASNKRDISKGAL